MYPKSFKKLIDYFSSLPSVGPKMAERLVLYLFKQDKEMLAEFGNSLSNLKINLRYCEKCFNISEGNLCEICSQKSRNQKKICVVEEPLDIIAIERTKKYAGLYHVLGGTLGITKKDEPSQLKLNELEKRVGEEKVEEIILAMNPTTEGDATALYIARMLKDSGVKITKLARGLSTGGDIEYADELTLGSAILNRK
ncbi:MAG: recombination protein RecR [Candidatus Moranbacteria bacterium RIFOXYA12_FULL_35_19]|nr:MAG: Recombination protein RecR [Candidatus Moranbacteria bacterium GW2011_GWF2_35_39]OGI30159.1 MAG: recombination protein RecR [Candidatus Moranbacteria bacterium RIFOXYB12_FULL_35_8]OGI33290.1 MAG: recombination protein RecR [Candidatus Moranbacteria bacterium RIFOXYC12_FULL_36_13]OGI36808.1 MAG: recombination protein RecR [Candidatus Moranbacteria bacterium RIFOXYA12_FULL_35_19]